MTVMLYTDATHSKKRPTVLGAAKDFTNATGQ